MTSLYSSLSSLSCASLFIILFPLHSSSIRFFVLLFSYSHTLIVCLLLILFATSALGVNECGNTGEAYYNIDGIGLNGGETFLTYPYWLFGSNPNTTCVFTRTDCNERGNGGCVVFDGTYLYVCTIVNVTNVTSIVSSIHNFTYGYYMGTGSSPCGCSWPSTPSGKYANGFSISIPAKFSFSMDATYEMLAPCKLTVSYQNTPLQNGDTFTQKIILESKHGRFYWFEILGIIALIVIVILIVACCTFCYFKRRRHHHHHHYTHL